MWEQFGIIPFRSQTVEFHNTLYGSPPARTQLSWAKVLVHDAKIWLLGYSAIYECCTPKSLGLEALMTSTFVTNWNLQVQITGKLKSLIGELWSGQGVAISDGSYANMKGLAAWIF